MVRGLASHEEACEGFGRRVGDCCSRAYELWDDDGAVDGEWRGGGAAECAGAAGGERAGGNTEGVAVGGAGGPLIDLDEFGADSNEGPGLAGSVGGGDGGGDRDGSLHDELGGVAESELQCG